MQFIYAKNVQTELEVILCQVLSELPQHVLPLPCTVCISMPSEHRHRDGITQSQLLDPVLLSSYKFLE